MKEVYPAIVSRATGVHIEVLGVQVV